MTICRLTHDGGFNDPRRLGGRVIAARSSRGAAAAQQRAARDEYPKSSLRGWAARRLFATAATSVSASGRRATAPPPTLVASGGTFYRERDRRGACTTFSRYNRNAAGAAGQLNSPGDKTRRRDRHRTKSRLRANARPAGVRSAFSTKRDAATRAPWSVRPDFPRPALLGKTSSIRLFFNSARDLATRRSR